MKKDDIITAIAKEYGDIYIHSECLPEPYCEDMENVSAIVLGCDPSNDSGEKLNKVFGIGEDGRYFSGIKRNLGEIGLGMSDIYIDNLCKNYFKNQTYDHEQSWLEIADKYWVPYLKDELDKLFPVTIPVFATSEILLKALCYEENSGKMQAESYYKNCIHIKPHQNKLNRNIIPLFRHPKYSLKKQPDYTSYIKGILSTVYSGSIVKTQN